MTTPPPPPPSGPPPFDPGYTPYPYGSPNPPPVTPTGTGYPQYGPPPFNPGGYPGPWGQPPARRSRMLPWLIAAVVLLVLIPGFFAAKTVLSQRSSTSDVDSSVAAAPETPLAPTPAPPPAAKADCLNKKPAPGSQTPAGWRTVLSPRNLAYDVPANWTVNECTTLMGWERPCPDGPFGTCPIRTMSGTAKLPNPTCPKSVLAMSGVPGAKDVEDIDAAIQSESNLVSAIYTSDSGIAPKVALSAPTPLTISGNPAVKVVATVTDIAGDSCGATAALHAMVATKVPGQPGCVMFVLSMDQGIAGALNPSVADQIIETLRVAG